MPANEEMGSEAPDGVGVGDAIGSPSMQTGPTVLPAPEGAALAILPEGMAAADALPSQVAVLTVVVGCSSLGLEVARVAPSPAGISDGIEYGVVEVGDSNGSLYDACLKSL